jgi:hypothetical protein
MVIRDSIATILLCLAGSTAVAQSSPDHASTANDLVQQVVDHEINSPDRNEWSYRQRTENTGTVEVAQVVETKNADLRRVLTRNGQPLTEQQAKSDDQAVAKFIASPEEQRKQRQVQNEDLRKTNELFALLAKALVFDYAEPQGSTIQGSTIKLNFRPNPDFHPPSREAHVFHEMEGQLTIDREQKRVIEFSGHLLHEVKFGILGHLDQGGTFDVRQQEVASSHWQVTLIKIDMRGKALFFKTLNVQQNEERSHFLEVPDTLTLAQAAELPRKTAAN